MNPAIIVLVSFWFELRCQISMNRSVTIVVPCDKMNWSTHHLSCRFMFLMEISAKFFDRTRGSASCDQSSALVLLCGLIGMHPTSIAFVVNLMDDKSWLPGRNPFVGFSGALPARWWSGTMSFCPQQGWKVPNVRTFWECSDLKCVCIVWESDTAHCMAQHLGLMTPNT